MDFLICEADMRPAPHWEHGHTTMQVQAAQEWNLHQMHWQNCSLSHIRHFPVSVSGHRKKAISKQWKMKTGK